MKTQKFPLKKKKKSKEEKNQEKLTCSSNGIDFGCDGSFSMMTFNDDFC